MMVKSGGYPSVLKEKFIEAMPNVGLAVYIGNEDSQGQLVDPERRSSAVSQLLQVIRGTDDFRLCQGSL